MALKIFVKEVYLNVESADATKLGFLGVEFLTRYEALIYLILSERVQLLE